MPLDIYNKEFQNWLKGVFALNTTREALSKCVIERLGDFIKDISKETLEQFFCCLRLNDIVQLKTQKKGIKRWHCEHYKCKELMESFVNIHTDRRILKYQWQLTQDQNNVSQSHFESMDNSDVNNRYVENKLIWKVATMYMFIEKGETTDRYQNLDNLDIAKVIKMMRSCEVFVPDGSISYYEAVIESRNEVMHSPKNQMLEEKTNWVVGEVRNLLRCLDIADKGYYKDAIQELQDLEDKDFVIKYQPEEYKQIVAKVLKAKDIAVEIHNAISVDHQCKSLSKCLQEMLEKISGTSSATKKALEFKPAEYKSIVKDTLEKKRETIASDKATCDEDSEEFNELQELEGKAEQDLKDVHEVLQKKDSDEMVELIDYLNEEVKTLQESKKEFKQEVEHLSREVKTLQEDKRNIEEEAKKYKEENMNLKSWSMDLSINQGNVQHTKQDSDRAENVHQLYSDPPFHGNRYGTYDETTLRKMPDETLNRKRQADIDTAEYRNGYPEQEDNPELNANYQFFMNEIPSKPQGDYIDIIHETWWGDYSRLEENRKYMQWLFPLKRKSCNREAQELQPHEIKNLKSSDDAIRRLLTSYKMMLDFYGMKLKNEEDGTIIRAENWKERFDHLNTSEHNHWRITRILKCLGEFDLEHLKKNFTKFVLKEAVQKGTLQNLIECCLNYWIAVLMIKQERDEMYEYYKRLFKTSSFKTM